MQESCPDWMLVKRLHVAVDIRLELVEITQVALQSLAEDFRANLPVEVN
jgi:hypothetical protein